MKKYIRYLPVVFIVLFLLLGDFVLLMKYKTAKEESSRYQNMYMQASQIGFTKIERDYYEAWDGSGIRLRGKGEKLAVLVFFTPNDCGSCVFALIRWSKMNKIFSGRVQVVGICSEQNDDYYRELLARYKFNFPIAKDTHCSGFKHLHPQLDTPVMVYLNGKNEVLDYDNTSTLPADDAGLEQKIRNLLKVVDPI